MLSHFTIPAQSICSYIVVSTVYMYLFTESKEDEVKSQDDGSDKPKEALSTHNFDIGSRIKHTHRYGMIRWIGTLEGLSNKMYAGVDMVCIYICRYVASTCIRCITNLMQCHKFKHIFTNSNVKSLVSVLMIEIYYLYYSCLCTLCTG